MRVLVVHPGPHFSVADVWSGWCKGLQAAGAKVVPFNFHDRLTFYELVQLRSVGGELRRAVPAEAVASVAAKGIESACYEFWPDVVLVISGFFVPPPVYELMRLRGQRVVLLCTESPYEDDKQIGRADWADTVIVNDPTNLELFRAVNADTHFIPHSYDPDVHRPREPEPGLASDFCFVGTGYPSRVEFFEQVDWSGVDVTLGGNWQRLDDASPLRRFVAHDIEACVDNADAHRMYASCKASANLYRKEAHDDATADGWAMGPREVELAASGTFFLREPRPEGDRLFPFLPTFSSPSEFGDKLRWWLARPDDRREAAAKAAAAVADRTFAHAAKRLLALLDR